MQATQTPDLLSPPPPGRNPCRWDPENGDAEEENEGPEEEETTEAATGGTDEDCGTLGCTGETLVDTELGVLKLVAFTMRGSNLPSLDTNLFRS